MHTSHPEDCIEIYTDGACQGNPGPGGWGALLCWRAQEKELLGSETLTTNNRMELTAVIAGLSALKKQPSKVTVYTDSRYVQQGISIWINNWKKKNWITSAKTPVKNMDLWMRLDALTQQHEILWMWVKGHAGNSGNERADALARRGVIQAACPANIKEKICVNL